MTDRPFPHDTTLDGPGADEPKVIPEQDPDDAMEAREERDRLEREHDERRAYVRAADLYSLCHIEFLHTPRG